METFQARQDTLPPRKPLISLPQRKIARVRSEKVSSSFLLPRIPNPCCNPCNSNHHRLGQGVVIIDWGLASKAFEQDDLHHMQRGPGTIRGGGWKPGSREHRASALLVPRT